MERVFEYTSPDQYEKLCGLQKIKRAWLICSKCGWAVSKRDYDPYILHKVYLDSYRTKDFRGESIDETFNRIWNLPEWKSENKIRFDWFSDNIKDRLGCVLDVGSGLGVWPYLLNIHGWDVTCVEPNHDSAKFIKSILKLDCFSGFFGNDVIGTYDVVTLVHILEHMENPIAFLKDIRRLTKHHAEIFIEVPDASEFVYLDKDHDEFNSCHLVFFNMKTLIWAVELAGLTVMDIHRQRYSSRNLTRIMAVCKNEADQSRSQN